MPAVVHNMLCEFARAPQAKPSVVKLSFIAVVVFLKEDA